VDKSDNELLTDFVQKKFLQNPDSMDIQGPTELTDKYLTQIISALFKIHSL